MAYLRAIAYIMLSRVKTITLPPRRVININSDSEHLYRDRPTVTEADCIQVYYDVTACVIEA